MRLQNTERPSAQQSRSAMLSWAAHRIESHLASCGLGKVAIPPAGCLHTTCPLSKRHKPPVPPKLPHMQGRRP